MDQVNKRSAYASKKDAALSALHQMHGNILSEVF
ncbi:hypothetical protein PSYPI_26024 [Pseudomonas syringae pv. pisi str. 1704B]|uniref:Uncharacterized protein n=1 Tax=Pseudomonas syringae pv. pisi str. 1704B TaxID=629263 RepID=F3GES4_PSESJ|nr:hypothetical protein PSYPI_26024 [Pseudomonas syringae pv. pisi str. 1704B]